VSAGPVETLSGDPTLELPEFDSPPEDPLPLLERWLRTADERGVREPRALALATADGEGRPSEEESDALFAERPAAGRATTVASDQGAPLGDPAELRRKADELSDKDLHRPPTGAASASIPT
jgi:pyridoxine/pyridoxamine 5'-phosphate oxidase